MGVEQNGLAHSEVMPASTRAVESFTNRIRVTPHFELRRQETEKKFVEFLLEALPPGYLPIYQQHFQSGADGFIEIVLQPLQRSSHLLSHKKIESLLPSEQELVDAQQLAINLARWYAGKYLDVQFRLVVNMYDSVKAPSTQHNGTYHTENGLLVRRGEAVAYWPEREIFPTLEPLYYSEAHTPSPYMFSSMFLKGADLITNHYGASHEAMTEDVLSMFAQKRDAKQEKARQLALLEKEAAQRKRQLLHPDQFVEYGFESPYQIEWMRAASNEFQRVMRGVDRNSRYQIKQAVPAMLRMIATDPRNPIDGNGGFSFNRQETIKGDHLYHIGHHRSSTGLVYSLHEQIKRVNILACRKY